MRICVTLLAAGALSTIVLNGCSVSDVYPLQSRNLDAEKDQFLAFATKCYRQTSKISRLLPGAIFISDRRETPEGKMLLMEAAGTYFNCHQNRDGSVTVTRAKDVEPFKVEPSTSET
ncbi:MAG: hypothetical protein ACR2O0_01395 [Rhizobiaceae bacterium]